jgi:hypothetical protein
LSERTATHTIRLALDIADPALADRLAALLAGVAGLRLVGPGEAADAAVVTRAVAAASTEADNALTARELEVRLARWPGQGQGPVHGHRADFPLIAIVAMNDAGRSARNSFTLARTAAPTARRAATAAGR